MATTKHGPCDDCIYLRGDGRCAQTNAPVVKTGGRLCKWFESVPKATKETVIADRVNAIAKIIARPDSFMGGYGLSYSNDKVERIEYHLERIREMVKG